MSNNTLQVALDPSVIQINGDFQMSLMIAGLSFEKIENEDENENENEKKYNAAKKVLQCFHDHLKYNKIRLFFLDNSGLIKDENSQPIFIDLDINGSAHQEGIKEYLKYIDYIEAEIGENLNFALDKEGKGLTWNYAPSEKLVEIEVNDDNYSEEDEKLKKVVEGYSNMAFANFSQLLSPINEAAGLVFFNKT